MHKIKRNPTLSLLNIYFSLGNALHYRSKTFHLTFRIVLIQMHLFNRALIV